MDALHAQIRQPVPVASLVSLIRTEVVSRFVTKVKLARKQTA